MGRWMNYRKFVKPLDRRSLDAWGSLDALIGHLRAAYEENGGKPEANLFGARAVRLYLREVRDSQAKARGILALPLDGDDVRCEAFGPWRSSFADKYGPVFSIQEYLREN